MTSLSRTRNRISFWTPPCDACFKTWRQCHELFLNLWTRWHRWTQSKTLNRETKEANRVVSSAYVNKHLFFFFSLFSSGLLFVIAMRRFDWNAKNSMKTGKGDETRTPCWSGDANANEITELRWRLLRSSGASDGRTPFAASLDEHRLGFSCFPLFLIA